MAAILANRAAMRSRSAVMIVASTPATPSARSLLASGVAGLDGQVVGVEIDAAIAVDLQIEKGQVERHSEQRQEET